MSKNTSGVTRKAKVFTTTPIRVISKHALIWGIIGLVIGIIVSVVLGLGLHNKFMPTASVAFTAHTASNEVSTNADKVIDPEECGIKFEFDAVTYDPTRSWEAKISGNLPEGTAVQYYNNVHKNAGTYKAVAVIHGEGYAPLVLETEMVIEKADITGLSFDKEYIFEYKAGNTYPVAIKGNLPGVPGELTVEYKGNDVTKSGDHKVTATISGPNYNTLTLNTTVHVVDLNALAKFPSEDKCTFTYDGTAHSVVLDTSKVPSYVKNMPGYKVTHTTNQYTNAGRYEVTATISVDGFETVSFTTYMVINKLALNDVDGFDVKVGSCEYDGNAHGATIENLPEGVNASVTYYLGEEVVAPESVVLPGTYKVVFEFVDTTGNYEVESIEKTLEIKKKDITEIFTIKGHSGRYKVDDEDNAIERTVTLEYNDEVVSGYFGEDYVLDVVYYILNEKGERGEALSEAPVFTEVGKHTIEVVIKGNDLYKDTTLRAVVEIKYASLSDSGEAETRQLAIVSLKGSLVTPKVKDAPVGAKITYKINGEPVEGVKYAGRYYIQIVVTDGNYQATKNVTLYVLPNPLIALIFAAAFTLLGVIIGLIVVLFNNTREDFSESHFVAPSAAVAKVREGVICESYAKYNNTGKQGRLYLSKQALEFYADDYKTAKNNILINVADIRNINVLSSSKIQIYANHKEYIFTVPGGRAADWVDEIVRL